MQAKDEYEASMDRFRAASRQFSAITEKYRNREIDDSTFLAAKSEFTKAGKDADAAESKFLSLTNEERT